MADPIATLMGLLELKSLQNDVYQGESPDDPVGRLYGGLVTAQALRAAGSTVEPDRLPNSLHGYFLRGGRPAVPVGYEVDRLRDGRSFSHRQVTAIQDGRRLFTAIISFHVPTSGFDHSDVMPAVSPPESLPTIEEELAHSLPEAPLPLARSAAFDLRYTEPLSWSESEIAGQTARNRMWVRTRGEVPAKPLLHSCLFAYVSDLASLDAARRPHAALWGPSRADVTSLDHTIWFHSPPRVDRWLLIDQRSPVARNGRGLAASEVFSADGTLVAGIAQEGLFR